MPRILIIDDDAYICKLLENYLNKHGFQAEAVHTGNSGLKRLKENTYQLLLCDYRLPDRNGLEILTEVRSMNTGLPVIIMTAYEELETAVKLIKAGAYDYITKPLIHEEVLDLIREAADKVKKPEPGFSFEKDFIKGRSVKFSEILELVKVVAPVDMNVIIEGETGSGKEFIARAIHVNSQRSNGPFVAVDCGALPKGIVNSELFGHIKGSFTGASYDKKGLFEQAHQGTLFLDEISNLDEENQMKLLRVLQERRVTRTGDTQSIQVDVRLVVASNEDLMNEVREQRIREDLYHRLNEFKIKVPPLRERDEDVLEYAEVFIKRASKRFSKVVKSYDQHVRKILLNYTWPGNIRELKNVMTRSVLLAKSEEICLDDIPEEIRTHQALIQNRLAKTSPLDRGLVLKEAAGTAEKEAIIEALVKSNYNKTKAAKMLKIDRKTLYNKIKQFNISLIES